MPGPRRAGALARPGRLPFPAVPFLFLATRADDAAADDEYSAMLRACRLEEGQLRRVRLERDPLGAVDLDEWAGVIVGGSPFNISDPLDVKSAVQQRVESEMADLLHRVVQRDHPFFGACYGIGALAVHQGGIVDRTFAEPVGPVEVELTPAGCADPVFGGLPRRFTAFVGHKEAVAGPPPSSAVLAGSVSCPVQAIRVGSHVYATQFHPELDVDGLCLRVDVYRHAGYFPPDQAEAVKAAARQVAVVAAAEPLRAFAERYG